MVCEAWTHLKYEQVAAKARGRRRDEAMRVGAARVAGMVAAA